VVGSVVQTVPTTSQVDFSQLVNLPEVLSGNTNAATMMIGLQASQWVGAKT
jgi:choline dehydrogenase-like flavoprotein